MSKRISAKWKLKFTAIVSSYLCADSDCWQSGSQSIALSSEHILQEFQIVFVDICDKNVSLEDCDVEICVHKCVMYQFV